MIFQPGQSFSPAISLFTRCTAPTFTAAPYFALACRNENTFKSFHLSSPDTFHPLKVADYKKIFDKFDVDSGGTIDTQELGTLIRGLGWVNLVLVFLLQNHFIFI